MLKNLRAFLYIFDLIGMNPQLLIFNNRRYKTIFSSILSIIIIIFSIAFAIFSLTEYLKYESPIIVYTKDNDMKTRREMILKNTILMFQLIDSTNYLKINDSIAYYKGSYSVMFDNGTYDSFDLTIEKCEIGKNINIKYKDFIDGKYKFERNIEEFYCINNENNISLFYHPNIGYSYITLYIKIKNNLFAPEKIQSLIVSENDLIDHNNKSCPINNNFNYYFTSAYSSSELTKIVFNNQYIKYDSDEGLFYKDSNILSGISFSDMSFTRTVKAYDELKDALIAEIKFEMNKSYYDNYKRTYSRLQSLLADVMSVVNLLFEIGRQISLILCSKNMSKDIIQNILNEYEKNKLNHEKKINKKIKNKNETSERNKIKNELENSNITNYLNKEKNNLKTEKNNKILSIKRTIKKINYFHILKSYLCFRDKKTKLINIIHNIINEDMCIEKILGRFYNLERIFHHFSKKEKENYEFFDNRRLSEIKKYILKNNNNKLRKNKSIKEEKNEVGLKYIEKNKNEE